MTLRIAVLSDIHLDDHPVLSDRRGELADIFLLRAVHRLNRFIKPDVTVILGDLIDQGQSSSATHNLQRLKNIIELLESPTIILPGNHDGNIDTFYSIFNRPVDHLDINGVRFVPFIDPEEPNYNARRTKADLKRMVFARENFTGPLVALQHVSLFPPGESDCPYNYTNASDIISVMRNYGYTLSLSGHYHKGLQLTHHDDINFLAVPALCESPFIFWEVLLDGGKIDVIPHQLQMPPQLCLIDHHIHTPYAYCSQNMDLAKTQILAKEFGLADVIFTEHSSHLYYDRHSISTFQHFIHSDTLTKSSDCRIDEYFADLEKSNIPPASRGLEVDSDFHGRPMLLPEDRSRANFFVGAVHCMKTIYSQETDIKKVCDDFLALHEKFLASGINVLAHPFRVLRWAKLPVPSELFAPLIKMLRKNNVAAEINFHCNTPSAEFIKLCIDSGVKISLGSDSHNLYEIGEFAPHLAFLKSFYNGDLQDILL